MKPSIGRRTWMLTVFGGMLLLFAIIFTAPKPTDWTPSYSLEDKIPLGNKILYELLPTAFPKQQIEVYRDALNQLDTEELLPHANYIVINQSYTPDSLETAHLLANVEAGCHAFVAAGEFSKYLMDTLRIKLHEKFSINASLNIHDSLTLNFSNPKVAKKEGYVFRSAFDNVYFAQIDTATATILGTNKRGHANFIALKIGQGELLIHTNPMLFSNYHMVTDDHSEYVFKCLSYLPVRHTVWDEYYKEKPHEQGSFLGFIARSNALHSAWILLLCVAAVYLAFEAKRRQRPIPVVVPPTNTSLQFIDTIGRLYYSRKNHWDIAKKKYTYFADFVRSNYYINLHDINKEGMAELSAKAQIPISTIDQIVKKGKALDQTNHITENDLITFNQIIEFFYHHCK